MYVPGMSVQQRGFAVPCVLGECGFPDVFVVFFHHVLDYVPGRVDRTSCSDSSSDSSSGIERALEDGSTSADVAGQSSVWHG